MNNKDLLTICRELIKAKICEVTAVFFECVKCKRQEMHTLEKEGIVCQNCKSILAVEDSQESSPSSFHDVVLYCPSCSDMVTVDRNGAGEYTCPICLGTIGRNGC